MVYNKVQCSLFWVPEFISDTKIPPHISHAYIITGNKKLYAFNKKRKNTINEIQLSAEEFNRLIKILGINLQIKPDDLSELLNKMCFEQINAIFTITTHKIFDSAYSFPKKNMAKEKNSNTNKNESNKEEHGYFEPVHKKNEKKTAEIPFIEPVLSLEKKELICQQCGGDMLQTNHSSGNFTGILKAMIIFFLGLFVLFAFFWTLIGIIIGVLLMIMSLGMGGNREKIWKCQNCGYYFKRI